MNILKAVSKSKKGSIDNELLILFFSIQVDGLDLKVDKLCQLAGSLLERAIRQQTINPTSAPTPPPPIIINRIRTGARWHVYRRRRLHHRHIISTNSLSQRATVTLDENISNPSRANLSQSMGPPPPPPSSTSTTRDYSQESLISLYWLFQDHLNSSRTHNV